VKHGEFASNWVVTPEWQNIVEDWDEVERGVTKVEGLLTGEEMGEEDDGVSVYKASTPRASPSFLTIRLSKEVS
jgi:hypothetical protein